MIQSESLAFPQESPSYSLPHFRSVLLSTRLQELQQQLDVFLGYSHPLHKCFWFHPSLRVRCSCTSRLSISNHCSFDVKSGENEKEWNRIANIIYGNFVASPRLWYIFLIWSLYSNTASLRRCCELKLKLNFLIICFMRMIVSKVIVL